MSNLEKNDTKKNLKAAFVASDSEQIMRVVDYSDIVNRKQIDPLSIMTYLYQMRDHFENLKSKNVNCISNSDSEQRDKERENVEKSIKKLSSQVRSNPFDECEETDSKEKNNEFDSSKENDNRLNPFSEPCNLIFVYIIISFY